MILTRTHETIRLSGRGGVSLLLASMAAGLAGSPVLAAEPPLVPKIEFEAAAQPLKPTRRPRPTAHSIAAKPAPELPAAIASEGFGTKSAFTASSVPSPDSTTLTPPVTLSYSGGATVLLINNKGTNRGVDSEITNSKNSTSALFGQTNGSGAGLTGYNSGTGGPAGKFGITNANSSEPAVFSSTNGTGLALFGIVEVDHGQPAVVGENTTVDNSGTGVEGLGGEYGVQGYGVYAGVYGSGQGYGLFGFSAHGSAVNAQADDGFGLYANSTSGIGAYISSASGDGLYAYSQTSYAIYAETNVGTAAVYANNQNGGAGVEAHSASGYGITATSDTGNAIMGQSTNNHGVIGEDFGSGDGVYGYSSTGYAGYFAGKVGATSYVTLSDRNAKTEIHPIDSKAILDKVSDLAVSSWVFKSDPKKNHIGPMAQDFHAAFGLDGDDDTRINLTDIVGVSLASIKELSNEMKDRDAQMRMKDDEIALLKQQLAVQTQALMQMRSVIETVAARMTTFEQQQPRSVAATRTVSQRREAAVRE